MLLCMQCYRIVALAKKDLFWVWRTSLKNPSWRAWINGSMEMICTQSEKVTNTWTILEHSQFPCERSFQVTFLYLVRFAEKQSIPFPAFALKTYLAGLLIKRYHRYNETIHIDTYPAGIVFFKKYFLSRKLLHWYNIIPCNLNDRCWYKWPSVW